MNLRFTLAVLLAFVGVGCSTDSTQPAFAELHPVAGLVTWNGKPASGGSIRFNPDPATQEFSINGLVEADGTYTLTTVRTTDKTGERKAGAPAGKYKVVYTPPLTTQAPSGLPLFMELPAVVTVTAGSNNIPVELGKK